MNFSLKELKKYFEYCPLCDNNQKLNIILYSKYAHLTLIHCEKCKIKYYVERKR